MRSSFCLAFALTLALAPAADATLLTYRSPSNDLVSLVSGRGLATFSARGAIYGKLGRGRIVVTDFPRGPRTIIKVRGAERVEELNARTKIYRGTLLRLRIERGFWRVRLIGRDIYASAVVSGTMTLKGRAGKYSIDGRPFVTWPRRTREFDLGD